MKKERLSEGHIYFNLPFGPHNDFFLFRFPEAEAGNQAGNEKTRDKSCYPPNHPWRRAFLWT